MKPRIKFGLIAGSVAALLNVFVATLMGVCGPPVTLLAGAVAGFLAAQKEKPLSKGDGARLGAVSGGIAGALAIIGQIIGAIGALVLMQQTGTPGIVGSIPPPSSPASVQVIYYLTGAGTGLCFGLVGAVLAALAGAAAGYFGTPDRPAVMPPPEANP